MKKTFLRVLSMCLAVILLAGSVNIGVYASQLDFGKKTATLQSTVSAAVNPLSAGDTVTDADIVADNYAELTDAEKAVLGSGALIGNSHTITAPTSDDLVTIDTENKIANAGDYVDGDYTWKPASAVVIFGEGDEEQTLPITLGESFASICPVESFYVEVTYELNIEVAEATQEMLLEAPYALSNITVNMEKVCDLNLSLLRELVINIYPYTATAGGTNVNGIPVSIKGNADSAFAALYNILDENGNGTVEEGESFELVDDVTEYNAVRGDSVDVRWIVDNGTAVASKLVYLRGFVSKLNAVEDIDDDGDVDTSDTSYLINIYTLAGYVDANAASVLKMAIENIDAINTAMSNESIPDEYWSIANEEILHSSVAATQLTDLNDAVKATIVKDDTDGWKSLVSNTTITVKNPLFVASTVITKAVAQKKVNVIVSAEVASGKADDRTLNALAGGSVLLVLKDDLSEDEVKAAIEANGIVDRVLADWTTSSPEYEISTTNYNVEYSGFCASGKLDADIDYSITFVPKTFDISTTLVDNSVNTVEDVPYGYIHTLWAHSNTAKSYDYTVNGKKMFQNDTVRVTENMTIVQNEGKSLTANTIPEFVAGSATPGSSLTEMDKNILGAGGLLFGTVSYSAPGTTDGLVTVDQTDAATFEYEIVAKNYSTAFIVDGNTTIATWIPSYAMVDGTKVTLDNGTKTFNHTGKITTVSVVYELTVDDALISSSVVKALAKLPDKLASDAATQSSRINAAVDLITTENFQKANSLASVLVSMLTNPQTNASYKAETIAAGKRLGDECLNASGTLLLADYLSEYKDKTSSGKLAYYYSGNNSVILNNQITALTEIFAALSDDTAFLDWADRLEPGASGIFTEYKDKIAGISVPAVDANIDTSAKMEVLTALANELLATGTTSGAEADGSLVYSASVEAAVSGVTLVNVSIDVNGVITGGTITFDDGDVFDDINLAKIAALIDELKAAATKDIDTKYYDIDDAELPAVGSAVSDYANATFTATYTPKTYTVDIENVTGEDISFTYGKSMFMYLPRPEAVDGVYRYTIGTKTVDVPYKEGEATYAVELTASDIDSLFGSSTTLTVSRVDVDTTRENFLKFVDAVNTAFKAGNMDAMLIATEGTGEEGAGKYGLILRVGPGVTSAQYQSLIADLAMNVIPMYSEITLAGSTFWGGATISMQAIIDMLASSGFSFDSVYNMIDDNGNVKNDTDLQNLTPINGSLSNVGGKVATSDMTLNGMPVDLYITLYGSSETLLSVKTALGTIKNYINLTCENGVYNISLNMPEKVYPYYMSALLLLDRTSLDDIQAVDVEETIEYYKALVGDLVADPNFTVETLENTLAKLGRDVDLSTYADTFVNVRKLLNFLLHSADVDADTVESDNKHYAANITYPVSNAINTILGASEETAKFSSFIAEAQEGGSVSFTVDITVENRSTNYQAMIFDNSESGLGKFYYTTDLTSALAGLGKNSVVVLLDDATLSGDVVISNNVFINLNGKTLTGNLRADGTVRLTDSTLDSASAGSVVGTLEGNFVITGGKYNGDIDSMLKEGYVKNADGYVCSSFYTVEQDGEGNVNIIIEPDVLSTRTVPELKDIAVDLAFDIAFKVYNDSSLTVDGTAIYDFAKLTDVVDLATKSGSEILNTVIGCADFDGITVLANSILAELTDFAGIATAIAMDGGTIVSYDIATTSWDVEFVIADGNYITANIIYGNGGAAKNRILSVSVGGTTEEKAELVDIFTELGKIITVNDATVYLGNVEYNGGITADYSGSFDVDVDLSVDNNYAALMLAAVAANTGDAALKDALTTYLASGSTVELGSAFGKTTLNQFISGLKYLSGTDCATMLEALGVESADIEELAGIYSNVIYIAKVILTRLDITGGTQTIGDAFATHEFGPKVYRNVEVSLTLTILDKVEASEKPSISAPTIDLKASDADIRGYEIVGDYLYLDTKKEGITPEQLVGYLNYAVTNDKDGVAHVVVTGTTAEGLVATGSKVTATAENANGDVAVVVYTVIIDGDANCDGKLTSADAVVMENVYFGIISITEAAKLAADTNADSAITSSDAVRLAYKYTYSWADGSYVSNLGK